MLSVRTSRMEKIASPSTGPLNALAIWVRPTEVPEFMFPKSEATVSRPLSLAVETTPSGFDDEPPSSPRRHPVWLGDGLFNEQRVTKRDGGCE